MAKFILRFLFFAGFTAFTIGGLYFGYVFVSETKSTVETVFVPQAPEVELATPNQEVAQGQPEPGATPVVVSTKMPEPPDWKQKERVNILLMGIDQREDEVTRTDTMIMFSVDPYAKTASLLSIPRDLWVPIPGFYSAKINAAYPIGEGAKYPGGGPALAKKTIQENFGIPIHYFVTINFQGFKKIVDQMGGIDIDVPKYIHDDHYPTEDYGYQIVTFQPGVEHMNGERALIYSRTRYADSDFFRMRRQQQVIDAVRSKALSLDIITKFPQLLNSLSETLRTDLPPRQALSLARLIQGIDRGNITMREIDETMTADRWIDQQEVLIPAWDKIDPVVAELLVDTRLKEEGASVEVLNGTSQNGLARRASEYLAKIGFNVVSVGQAPAGSYPRSKIEAFGKKSYSQDRLTQLLGLSASSVEAADGTSSSLADFRVILGNDFKPAN